MCVPAQQPCAFPISEVSRCERRKRTGYGSASTDAFYSNPPPVRKDLATRTKHAAVHCDGLRQGIELSGRQPRLAEQHRAGERMTKRFDWNDLQYFLATARCGKLSRAARQMGVDHATVSRRLEALEQSLNVRLFERTRLGYNLTPAGEQLMVAARTIEAEAVRAENEVASDRQAVSGNVRIIALEEFGVFFLARHILEIAEALPNVKIEMVTSNRLSLSRSQADLFITLEPPMNRRFQRERLVDFRLFVYAHPKYLASAARIADRADLQNHPFVGLIDNLLTAPELAALPESLGCKWIKLRTSSLQAQMKMISHGHCLGILPGYVAAHDPSLVRVLPNEAYFRRTYWIVTPVDSECPPRVRAVSRFIREKVEASRTELDGAMS